MTPYTIVSEHDGSPLGVVSDGKPHKGDTVWVGAKPYEVTGLDRDVATVRDAGGSPTRAFRENSPSRQAGYRNPPIEEELPKYTRGPLYPGQPWPTSPPPAQPQFPGQYYAPPPSFEGVPGYQPRVWTAFHYRLMIPIFKLEGAYPPRPGTIERYGGEDYEVVRATNGAILMRPVRPWNLFLTAIEKSTGEAILFIPMAGTRERPRARQLLNRRMAERQYTRKMYQVMTIKPARFTSYFRNRGR